MAATGEAYSVHELTELAAKLERAEEKIARMEKALVQAGARLCEMGLGAGRVSELIRGEHELQEEA